jgi:hypothetical protein
MKRTAHRAKHLIRQPVRRTLLWGGFLCTALYQDRGVIWHSWKVILEVSNKCMWQIFYKDFLLHLIQHKKRIDFTI